MDIEELEQILFSSEELESKDKFEKIYGHQNSLGFFIRNIVGLDREAAKSSFAKYLTNTNYKSNQIRFIDQIINHLTHNGTMNPRLLYSTPFTDFSSDGIDGVFSEDDINYIIKTINDINKNAVA